jgi:hypothetical protein
LGVVTHPEVAGDPGTFIPSAPSPLSVKKKEFLKP